VDLSKGGSSAIAAGADNLMVNGIEAMGDVNAALELNFNSQGREDEQPVVSVSDTGVGLPWIMWIRVDSFFSAKPLTLPTSSEPPE
jgi:hypothetical protein